MGSLTESAQSGNRVATLRNLRDILAEQIENCLSLRDLAALSGRFQSVLEEIAALVPAKIEVDEVDEIARRRAARRPSAPKNPARAKRPG